MKRTSVSKSRGKLAIVVPHSGQPTETFIRKYAERLDPGNVVLVHFDHGADAWGLDAPTYFPERAFGGVRLLAKAWRGLRKSTGADLLFDDPYMAASLKRFLRDNNVSAVFSQYLVAGATVQKTVGSLGLRHVVRGHGFDLSSSLEQAEWRRRYLVLENCAAIVVPTPYQEKRLRANGLRRVPIHSQPCGIEPPPFHLGSPIEKETVQVLTVGRMVGKKAPLLALQAFLVAARECPNLAMTMVGTGPLLGKVRDCCARHPLGGRVKVTGSLPHDEVLRMMGETDVFLQHSITDPKTGDQEGAPVAILEAVARGVSVVSTRHSGIPYLVEEGLTGLLSDEGDVGAMAANLMSLAKDAGLRRRLGEAGRKRAEQFTWGRERELLMDLLHGPAGN